MYQRNRPLRRRAPRGWYRPRPRRYCFPPRRQRRESERLQSEVRDAIRCYHCDVGGDEKKRMKVFLLCNLLETLQA